MRARWLEISLIASVGLNVFLIGAVITVLTIHAPTPRSAGAEKAMLQAASANLTQPYRSAFVNLLRNEGKAIQADIRLSRRTRDQAWASLAVATFDPTTAKVQLAHARSLSFTARSRVEEAVIDFAAALPVAERVALGRAMRRTVPRQHIEPAPAKG